MYTIHLPTLQALLPWVRKLWPPVNVRSIMPEVIEHLMATITHFYSTEKVLYALFITPNHYTATPPGYKIETS